MSGLSGNSISHVWRDGDVVYKRQPKYLADNEQHALLVLRDSGYVPQFIERVDEETIAMEYVPDEPVTAPSEFMAHLNHVLNAIGASGLRHGDLTEYAVRVRDNRPIIIDWAESRVMSDPRPDKRRVSDFTLLKQTMGKLCQL